MLVTRGDIAALTPAERAQLAHWLLEIEPPMPPITPARFRRRRRLVLTVTLISAVVLVPWTIWLSVSLPSVHRAREWRTAWVGFDIVLSVALLATAWAGWHRRQVVVGFLIASATLLASDAWFDVLLSSGRTERFGSVATALLLELPLAALFFYSAYRVMRVTAAAVWQQQGRPGPLPALWRIPIVAPLEPTEPVGVEQLEVRHSAAGS
jgi:hypothetical protein